MQPALVSIARTRVALGPDGPTISVLYRAVPESLPTTAGVVSIVWWLADSGTVLGAPTQRKRAQNALITMHKYNIKIMPV